MAFYLTYAGLSGFLIVFGWCFVTDQPLAQCLVHGLVAMFLFALVTKWWLRHVFVELHHSLYEKQMAQQQAAFIATRETSDAAAAAAAADADEAVSTLGGAAVLAAQEAAEDEGAPEPLAEAA